ncbi:MAG: sigma-70 family RNA polymerase sigma factor [Oligoflexia bacterium]|nr:sigma-70 family RNA polymerase sigma factor [Oligoflexia bacterium]
MFNKLNHRFKSMLGRPALSSGGEPDRENDGALAKAFRNGEEWAFSAVYARYWEPIRRFVLGKVRDDEAASDLSQEVFLKVHRYRDSYRPEHALSTWIWTIARNTVADRFRRNPEERLGHEPAVEELACQKPNAEHLLVRESERARLARLVDRLTELQRKVLLMRVVQHLSYQEIAGKLDMSISAVKCLAYRAKRMLSRSDIPSVAAFR